jgi:hypothetical protein
VFVGGREKRGGSREEQRKGSSAPMKDMHSSDKLHTLPRYQVKIPVVPTFLAGMYREQIQGLEGVLVPKHVSYMGHWLESPRQLEVLWL